MELLPKKERFRLELRRKMLFDSNLTPKRFSGLPCDFFKKTPLKENRRLPGRPSDLFLGIEPLKDSSDELCLLKAEPQDRIVSYVKSIKESAAVSLKSVAGILAQIRHFFCSNEEPFREILVKSGIIPIILPFLKPGLQAWVDLQSETAALLRNLMKVDVKTLKRNIRIDDLIEFLVSVMESYENIDIIWALINLGDSEFKDIPRMMVESTIIEKLLIRLSKKNQTLEIIEAILVLLNILCKKEFLEIPNFLNDVYRCVICAKEYILSPYLQVKCNALLILEFLVTNEDDLEKVFELIGEKFFKTMLEDMFHSEVSIKKTALKIVATFLSGDDSITTKIISLRILDKFFVLMDSKDSTIRSDIYWAVSNILASESPIVEETVKHRLFDKILLRFKNEDYENRKQIICCIKNAILGSSAEISGELMNRAALEYFGEIISEADSQVLLDILESMEKIQTDLESLNDGVSFFPVNSLFQRILDEIALIPIFEVSQRAMVIAERHSRLPKVCVRNHTQLIWKPVLLKEIEDRTFTNKEKPYKPPAKLKIEEQDLRRMMVRYNTVFEFTPNQSKNSMLAKKILSSIKDNDVLCQLAEIFFENSWKQNENLNNPQSLQKLMGKVGIKLPDEVFSDGFEGNLMKITEEALDRGAFATPCYYIDPLKKFFSGVDRLHFVEKDLSDGKIQEQDRLFRMKPIKTQQLAFFYDFASPLSYFAASQIERIRKSCNAEVEFVPVLLGALLHEIGTNFVGNLTMNPTKAQYKSVEIQEWAQFWGVDFKFNSFFPLKTINALRIHITEPKTFKLFFEAAWIRDLDISDPEVLGELLRENGFNPTEVMRKAEVNQIKETLKRNTARAKALGFCGLPGFLINGRQIVWGQDKLNVVEDLLCGWNPDEIKAKL